MELIVARLANVTGIVDVERMMNKNTFVSRMDATIVSIGAARARSASP